MRKVISIKLLFFSITLCHSLVLAEIYEWTDADGSVHFSDSPANIPTGKRPNVRHEETDNHPQSTRLLSLTPKFPENKQATQTYEVPEKEPVITIDVAAETYKIQSVWNSLKSAVLRKDFETASRQFVPVMQAQYKAYFMASPKEAIARFMEVKSIEVYTIDGNLAQAGAVRDDPDGEFSYPLNFARGADGEWKVYGM